MFSTIAKNILGISEKVQDAGKLLSEIAFNPNLNKVEYVHLSNKLISYKKHKLLKSNVSDEADNPELALKLWDLSEKLCRSSGFVSFNI